MSSERFPLSNALLSVLAVSVLSACGSSSSSSSSPSAPSAAIDVRTATLTGGQEEPANTTTTATGRGAVVVDRTTKEITGGITFTLPAGDTVTSAAIYMANPGANATSGSTIDLTLQGTDTAIIPPNRILSADEYTALQNGELYFNVITSASAAASAPGEIRGQLTGQGDADASVVALSGAQETPPVTTAATGKGTIVVDKTSMDIITSEIQFTGINVTGNASAAAHIHILPAGTVIIPFNLTPGTDLATAPPAAKLVDPSANPPSTSTWYPALIAGNLYFNVHSTLNPGGEILGKIQVQAQSQAGMVPTLTSIQENVFTPICSVCHTGGAAAPQGLDLTAGQSFLNLVGVASHEVSTLGRVTALDPNNSYIIKKLEGTQTVGLQMPRGQPPLPQGTINVIRQWIKLGALNN